MTGKDPLEELRAGIAFWKTKLGDWPADFHNADYKKWAAESPDFSDTWWNPFLRPSTTGERSGPPPMRR